MIFTSHSKVNIYVSTKPVPYALLVGGNMMNGASTPAVPSSDTDNTHNTHRGDSSGPVGGPEPALVCVHVLCGHQSPVTAISYSTDLDIVLSGSQSGLICLHSVRKGKFMRSISNALGSPVDLVLATSPGYLISHSWTDQSMHVFWINGQYRASVRTTTR